MKYLLHGDDLVNSRAYLTDLTQGHSVTSLDGKKLAVAELEEHVFSNSLFVEEKAIVVENLFSKNPKKKELVVFINSFNGQTLLILWEEKKLPKTTFSSLKDTTVKDFLFPSSYFQFLDSFSQGNGKRLFIMFEGLLKTMSEEQIFYSLIKRIRLLLILASNGKSDELLKMAPWQLSKLKNQLRQWNSPSLASFYQSLLDTEIKLKTGGLPIGLSKHLDTLMLTQL